MLKLLAAGFQFGVDDIKIAELEENLQNVDTFKWYIVPLFVILFYMVWKNIREKRYSVVFGGFAFWLADVFNETWNSMVYYCTGAPVWGTVAKGDSALQILVGYNIEISLMFFMLGMAACYMIETTPGYEGNNFWEGNKNYLLDPRNLYYLSNKKSSELTDEEKKAKKKAIWGRVSVIIAGSISAVVIEILLNAMGLLTWEKSWWQWYCPWILFIIGYCPFFTAAIVIHDAPRKWQIKGLLIELGICVALLLIAGLTGMLGKIPDPSKFETIVSLLR